MNDERAISMENSSPILEGASVLVVDGDSACLTIISRMLCNLGYRVLTAKRASDALSIVREREHELHLVLTEVHLPDMNKYELLERMRAVSKLPVVIMSDDDDDDDENAMLGGLFKGAVFYFLKPLKMKSLKNLWQFAFTKKRDLVIELDTEEESSGHGEPQQDSTSDEQQSCRISLKRKNPEWTDKDEERDSADSSVLKKRKLVWTIELHKRFLQAVRLLGVDSAQPKKILQHMNVPGLRKENVSSHLQKYRLSLKREQEAIVKARNRNSNQSSFPSYHSSSSLNLQGGSSQFQSQFSTSTSYQPAEMRSHFQNLSSHMSTPCPGSAYYPSRIDSDAQETLGHESSFPSFNSSSNSNQIGNRISSNKELAAFGQVGSFIREDNFDKNMNFSCDHTNLVYFPTLLHNPIQQEEQRQQLQPHVLFSPPVQMPSPPTLPQEQQGNDIFGYEKQLQQEVLPSAPPLPAETAAQEQEEHEDIFGLENQLLQPHVLSSATPVKEVAAEEQAEHEDIFGLEKQLVQPHVLLPPQWQMPPIMPPPEARHEQGENGMFGLDKGELLTDELFDIAKGTTQLFHDVDFDDFW